MKATVLRSAANTQAEMSAVARLKLSLGRRIAKTSFLLTTSLAADSILETAHIDKIV